METIELRRNIKSFEIEAYFIGGASIVVAVIAAWIVGYFVHFSRGFYGGSRLLTFVVVIGIAGFALMVAFVKWQATHYSLTPEGIIVTRSVGMGGQKQKVYLYESIITASVTQNYFGRKHGYGDMHITIPKLETKLILKSIDNPSAQLPYLKSHIRNKSGANNVLVT